MTEEKTESRATSFKRHAIAALVLVICAWLLFHLLFHIVIVIATIAAVVVAIVGAMWAIHTLF